MLTFLVGLVVGAVVMLVVLAFCRASGDADDNAQAAATLRALQQAAEAKQVVELRRSREAWRAVATDKTNRLARAVDLLSTEQLAAYRAMTEGMACTDGERVA